MNYPSCARLSPTLPRLAPDGASSPRTPLHPPHPALLIPKSPNPSSRNIPARSDMPPPATKPAMANGSLGLQPLAQPTTSTISTPSYSFNDTHIAQPYLQGSAGSSTGANDLFCQLGHPLRLRPALAHSGRLIAEMWKSETPEVGQYNEAMSELKKAEHLTQYPISRSQPMKKADKERACLEKKAQKERKRAEAALSRSRSFRLR